MKMKMKLPSTTTTTAPLAAIALLAVAGAMVALASPGGSSASPKGNAGTQANSVLGGASQPRQPGVTSHTQRIASATIAPATATSAPAPTPTATAVPTSAPTATATPAPTWHTVGSWSGSGAATAGKVYIGSGNPVQYVYTCAATTPPWQLSIGFMSDAGSGGTQANTVCDGSSHTMASGPYTDNPGGDGIYTISISAESGTAAAWTLTAEVYS